MKKTPPLLCLMGIFTGLWTGATALAAFPEQSPKKLPIMTWLGPGKDMLAPEIFGKIAEAGFSVNMSFLGEKSLNLRALELARAAGIQLMVHDARIEKLVEDATLPLDVLDQVAADYKDHPALFGYYVLDEPNASKFGRLGEIVRRLAGKDPRHPAYINLFPTYANSQQLGTETYEQHLRAFLDTVKPVFLSYDHYPITAKGLRADYYRNLEIIRAAALEQRIPFWAFTLSVPHADYLPPTAARLRLQLFSDLAYGARGLQYFTYATPTGTDYDWKPALIDAKGEPTASYDLARQVNAEVRAVETLFLRWNSAGVYHSEPLPEGTRPLPPGGFLHAVGNAPAVIGFFKDGPDEYVMLVNRDYENARLAVLELAPEVRALVETVKSQAAPARLGWAKGADGKTAAIALEPGDARIFKIVR